MMDTRLICQVVEWERIIELENEKQKNNRPNTHTCYQITSEPHRNDRQSSLGRLFKLIRHFDLSLHSSEPA